MNWDRCTKSFLCPKCASTRWCSVSHDGKVCHCMRVSEGGRPSRSKKVGGWYHELDGSVKPPPAPKTVVKKVQKANFASLAEKCRCALIDANGLPSLSVQLGLSVEYLEEAGAGWLADYEDSTYYRGYTFPMHDATRLIIGLQIRTQKGKRSVPGSAGGLFWPQGVSLQGPGPLLLPEGASSCGACRDLRFDIEGKVRDTGLDVVLSVAEHYCPDVQGQPDSDQGAQQEQLPGDDRPDREPPHQQGSAARHDTLGIDTGYLLAPGCGD